ncbi:LacI family DNA-binding transcriptional regulator [Chitinophaga niabensis]|uniref:Transcriptional regulator, LacI family n=1 Tax=Chitinophaga niabensis TaxID=536979 RepID=A0A1N6G8G1_9BACT|nr:LacI family DNA-binding transcriptional regulator [Chitinophaga niabensis]SIO03797.1 transcriptional regulator, LacI family [Chitinophaga niabensis]
MKFDDVITIKDIAKALNLSTSTVSRALRGRYEISAETKKMVLEYAERMNYRPNLIALSLKEQRSKAIGIVVSEIANNFFSQAINGIESIAYNRGYHVIITQSHESRDREMVNVQHLVSRNVDGLLLSFSCETTDISYFQQLHEKGFPMVQFDRVMEELDTHKVIADNYQGAFHATEHLISRGFRKIGHITSTNNLNITRERLQGYKDALLKHHIPYDEELVKHCNRGGMIYEEVEEAVESLFFNKSKIDALFTAGDRLTTVCLSALKNVQNKYKQVGFIGFTNTNLADLFTPSVSVVRQPAFEIGQRATELLIEMIESKKPITDFEQEVLSSHLIVRDSSKPL